MWLSPLHAGIKLRIRIKLKPAMVRSIWNPSRASPLSLVLRIGPTVVTVRRSHLGGLT